MELDGLVKAGVRRAPLVRRFVLAAHEAHLHDFNCFFFFFREGGSEYSYSLLKSCFIFVGGRNSSFSLKIFENRRPLRLQS